MSDALPFGRLWYGEPNAISNAIGYAGHRSRSHDAVALRSSAPILKGKVDSGDLQVIGGYYSLDTGAVTFVNGKSPRMVNL